MIRPRTEAATMAHHPRPRRRDEQPPTPAGNETGTATEGAHISNEARSMSMVDDLSDLFRHESEPPSVNGTSVGHALLSTRDVYSPKITSPGSTSVWVAGTTVTVTWYVRPAVHVPAQASHSGRLFVPQGRKQPAETNIEQFRKDCARPSGGRLRE